MGDLWLGIEQAMASVIKLFASIGGGNTAIGIILFTIFVRVCLLPLTLKSVRSSRSMQQLQPLIKEINKRYETKAGQRLSQEKTAQKQQEVMALYKEYSVNPAAGCLPVFIQIPIFFAVYGAVNIVVGKADPLLNYLQHSWGVFSADAAAQYGELLKANQGILWLNDLTKPDPLYILPVLMMIFQFMTTRMSMPRGGGADDQQRRINGIMQWTPLIFGFTAFQFPVGPVIYWVTTSIFSTVQQFFITGWGSLAGLPGLGFLPEKKIKQMELKKRDPNKPGKKSLMERLAENQDRLQTEQKSKLGTASADASGEEAEVPEAPKSNFGRKASSLESRPPSTDNGVRTSLNGGNPEINKRTQAYNQLNQRPPKKPAAGELPPGNRGNSSRGKKK